MATKPSLKAAEDFLSFVNASPTPFHAVKSAKERLEKVGFKHIKERDSWAPTLQPGGKYYLTRNGSSIVAFAIGKKWKAGNPIGMIGAHTDSPCLRIKPVSKRQNDGFLQVACETYGGGLWHTWFDRDLSIAGRAMVRTKDGTIEQRLVKVDRPILRIPTLAIHLDRQENFQFNKETQLFPIAGLVAAELNRQGKTEASKDEATESKDDSQIEPLAAPLARHHPYIVDMIAEEAGATSDDVVDFEMVLYDTQKSVIGGLNNELIFSPRLDNLMMTYCSVEGLIKSLSSSAALDNDSTIRLIACFDHEEIGSQTAQGADSNLLPAVIRRLSVLPASENVSDNSYDKLDVDTATAYEQTLSTGPDNVHRVQLDFKPSMQDELDLHAGQLVRMLHEYDDGWALCIRMDRSQQGVVPRTCLSKHPVKPRTGPPRQGPPPPGMRGPPIRSPMGPGGIPQPRPLSPGSGRNSPHPPSGRNSPGPRQMQMQNQMPPQHFGQQNPRGRSNSNAPSPQFSQPRQRSNSNGPMMAPPLQMDGRPRSNSASQAGARRGPAPGMSPMNPNAGQGVGQPVVNRKPLPGMAI